MTLLQYSFGALPFLLLFCMLQSTPSYTQLVTDFYNTSCPQLEWIVLDSMSQAIQNETRMAASILRLFFHDCFVQGCDGSILLDDTPSFTGEKTAPPNNNSVRGFEVIDYIKSRVEAACKGTVSCADILALASRDAVRLSGGPYWNVLLGRRDAKTASFSEARTSIPSATSDVDTLISKFAAKNLSVQDMVALSGAHTIGQARCINFRQRIYINQSSSMNQLSPPLNSTYLAQLEARCPQTGGDDNLSSLDFRTPTRFDTFYYVNLKFGNGLLNSDQVLFSTNGSSTVSMVQKYSQDTRQFSYDFAVGMINMGNTNPLTGTSGEIRLNCRSIN